MQTILFSRLMFLSPLIGASPSLSCFSTISFGWADSLDLVDKSPQDEATMAWTSRPAKLGQAAGVRREVLSVPQKREDGRRGQPRLQGHARSSCSCSSGLLRHVNMLTSRFTLNDRSSCFKTTSLPFFLRRLPRLNPRRPSSRRRLSPARPRSFAFRPSTT